LRIGGMTAPMVLDGAMDGVAFRAWVAQALAPTLEPGDIVVLDKLPSHKPEHVSQSIEAKGAELRYLPAYSPDRNPIENAFAQFKSFLKKVAARTIPALNQAIADALPKIKAHDCNGYFHNADYDRV
jgi:transposase